MILHLYFAFVGIGFVFLSYLAYYAFFRTSKPGASAFGWMSLTLAQIQVSFMALALTVNPDLAFVWARLRFLGIAFIPIVYLVFILDYTGHRPALNRWRVALLLIIPTITQAVVWFKPGGFYESWDMVRINGITLEAIEFTGWFGIHTLYTLVIFIGGHLLLVRHMSSIDSSRKQDNWVMILVISAGVILALFPAGLGPDPGFRITPIGLTIAGLGLGYLVFRSDFLNIVPIAYDAIIHHMRDAMLIFDTQQKLLKMNAAARGMFGSVPQFTPLATLLPELADLPHDEVEISRGSAEFSVHLRPLLSRMNVVGYTVVLRDVTRRKRMQQQEVTLGVELQRVKVLSDFIRDTSHDLKTPIATIMANLYLLRRMSTEARQIEKVDTIDLYIKHLNHMLADFQNMALVDSFSTLDKSPMRLEMVVQDVLDAVADGINQKQLTLSKSIAPDLPLVHLNDEWFHNALLNVVENAIAFTPAGGEIRVSAKPCGGYVQIEIFNSGSHIDEADLPRVFERLYKGDKARTQSMRTGLGLSMTRRVLELHHGTVDIFNREDGVSVVMDVPYGTP